MKLFDDYELRAFAYLGLGFFWMFCWLAITWATGKWFGFPARDSIFMWTGILMTIGFIDLILMAVGTLIIGQFKEVTKHARGIKG